MIGDTFQPRRRLRASQLNELARSADSAHLGAAGFLSQENGLEQVARSPRRPGSACSIFVQGMQWRITAKKGAGESFVVSVGPGIVAWGAGVNFSHPGEENLGALSAGQAARIVWVTSAAPLPLVHDPRWPTGNAPECGCEGCHCPTNRGDAAGTGGDAGSLLLVTGDWTAPDGTTDVREIGTVAVSDAVRVSIAQLQRDTIVARAIVGRKPGGEDPEDNAPNCGNPLNDEDDYNPLDHTSSGAWSGGGGGVGVDRNPLDDPGLGGYTPTCRDNIVNAA